MLAKLALASVLLSRDAEMITRSPLMEGVLDQVVAVAHLDSAVLLTGESGTGKQRVARFIHAESARSVGPFQTLHCGLLAESLLESELFGHARGPSPTATGRPGLLEAAHCGTLFLDGIETMPPILRGKLVQAFQRRVARRPGEEHDRPFDTRLIVAAEGALARTVPSRLHHGFVYRLGAVELQLPPLRDRRDDILPLARELLVELARRLGRELTGMSALAADQLLRHRWPGNVRELENAIEHAVAVARGPLVELADLPEEVRVARPAPATLGEIRPLAEIEREYILAALDHNQGNQTHTAKQLGIGQATLQRKLKSYTKVPRSMG